MPRPDPLAAYHAKRDFAKTAEPKGAAGKPEGKGARFVVQKHDATRLHFDFRLEIDGVLKSWAVTRGPSANPDDKRLAVRTEDHPIDYADFEGVIPAGEYGGGTVMLWDRGHWAPILGKSADDLDRGHLHFTLSGERMKGEWLLVRLKPRAREKQESWLLRKVEDAFAGGSDDLVGKRVTSISTGRTMDDIAAAVPARSKRGPKRRRASKPPPFRAPQLATLADHVPTGSGWLHEVKYDGYRAIVAVGGSTAKVYTRSGLDWSDRFPGIVAAASALAVDDALVDGEICALDDEGRPNFSRLQAALERGEARELTLFAFDLLRHDGTDLADLPLVARKQRLQAIVPPGTAIVFADHIEGHGEALLEAMCGEGYEGIVSKRADAPYASRRTSGWLKIKCVRRQEFVILGWTPSASRARRFGSLLLALNDGGALRYAGKVGTGFDAAEMEVVASKLAALEVGAAVAAVPRAAAGKVRWVKPELVAEVAFAEFTADGVVRHATFVGLRGDKPAEEVRPERPSSAAAEGAAHVRITNPGRVVFPADGITKAELAAYYRTVGAVMLPWAARRPISLVRCPQGRAKSCFFQKHGAPGFGDAVHAVPIAGKDGDSEDYLWVDTIAGLESCVQMGTIEFHGWGSRSDDVERPDRMVFDLDPDDGVDFDAVKLAAAAIRDHLADIGLASFAMLSGGKGVHVVVPLTPAAAWPDVTDFARRFAGALATAEPERFVATMSKAKRKGRIFIDWLRNQRGSTAVLPYVVRARPGAPVAAPVGWTELRGVETPQRFSLRDAEALLARAAGRDLRGWGVANQVLPAL